MSDKLRVVGVLSATSRELEHELERKLDGVPADRIVSISYSTSRILTIWLQHHALVVIRED